MSNVALNTIPSGISGLDTLLSGGYICGRLYLVQGEPGAGKSLLGQHFLSAGLNNDETVLYIHGEEKEGNITANAAQLSIDLQEAEFLDIGPETDFFTEDVSFDLVDPADVESERFIEDIKDVIEGVSPTRVFIDPITQLRYTEADEYHYRKRLLAFMRFFESENITVLVSRTRSQTKQFDKEIESVSDGVINLYRDEGGRRVQVPKHRGQGQREGSHGLEIRETGIEIYPQLLPNHENREFNPELLPSGVDELDTLLAGGIECGSITFVSGPTGIGKTTIATHFLTTACAREETVLSYHFEESIDQFVYRSEQLGLPVTAFRAKDRFVMREIETLTRSAEEVSQLVKADVEEHDPSIVLLDGIDGYKISLQGDDNRLTDRLHALSRYLKNKGICVILLDELADIAGPFSATSGGMSYIADNVILLTYLEQQGELNRAIGVLKKRLGDFESQFHWFSFGDGGLSVEGTVDSIHGRLRSGTETRQELD